MDKQIGQVSFYPSIVAQAVSHAIFTGQQEAAIDRRMVSGYTRTPDQLTEEEKVGLAG